MSFIVAHVACSSVMPVYEAFISTCARCCPSADHSITQKLRGKAARPLRSTVCSEDVSRCCRWFSIRLRLYLGETILINRGSIGADEYMDIRRYFLPDSVVDIYFVFIATVFGDQAKNCLNYLSTISPRPYFDMIVTSCYLSDMNQYVDDSID